MSDDAMLDPESEDAMTEEPAFEEAGGEVHPDEATPGEPFEPTPPAAGRHHDQATPGEPFLAETDDDEHDDEHDDEATPGDPLTAEDDVHPDSATPGVPFGDDR